MFVIFSDRRSREGILKFFLQKISSNWYFREIIFSVYVKNFHIINELFKKKQVPEEFTQTIYGSAKISRVPMTCNF